MRSCIVTGAAGFAGCNLVEALLARGCFVYAVVRRGSAHNERLRGKRGLQLIELDMSALSDLPRYVPERCDVFFHVAWQGTGRDDFIGQYENVPQAVAAVEAAAKLGCRRFIGTGSQAEYGIVKDIIREDRLPQPNTAYGAAKVAALYLTKRRAEQLGVEWLWGRIFSLYGKYEPSGRMLPDLMRALQEGREFQLTAATQNWDYLYSSDGAAALIALGECGRSGEIYNVANGAYRPLREFTEELRREVAPEGRIFYGDPLEGATSLQVSVEKIQQDTGWKAKVSFREGIRRMASLAVLMGTHQN